MSIKNMKNKFYYKNPRNKDDMLISSEIQKDVNIASSFCYSDNKIDKNKKYSFFDIADKIEDIDVSDSKMPELTRKHDNFYIRLIKRFFLRITKPIRHFFIAVFKFIKEKGNHERSILIFYKDERNALRLPITNFLILFYMLVIGLLIYTGFDALKKQSVASAFYESLSGEHKKTYNMLDEYDNALDEYSYNLNNYYSALKSLSLSINYIDKSLEVTKVDTKESLINNINSKIENINLEQDNILSYLNIASTVKSSIPLGYPIESGIRVTSGFGPRRSPFGGTTTSYHNGIDIAGTYGSRVYSVADGVVSYAGWRGGYGWFVIVDHKHGYQTAYGHNSKLLVHTGQRVKAGDTVALMGNTGRATGVHVHFEVRIDGKTVNPRNYLDIRL